MIFWVEISLDEPDLVVKVSDPDSAEFNKFELHSESFTLREFREGLVMNRLGLKQL